MQSSARVPCAEFGPVTEPVYRNVMLGRYRFFTTRDKGFIPIPPIKTSRPSHVRICGHNVFQRIVPATPAQNTDNKPIARYVAHIGGGVGVGKATSFRKVAYRMRIRQNILRTYKPIRPRAAGERGAFNCLVLPGLPAEGSVEAMRDGLFFDMPPEWIDGTASRDAQIATERNGNSETSAHVRNSGEFGARGVGDINAIKTEGSDPIIIYDTCNVDCQAGDASDLHSYAVLTALSGHQGAVEEERESSLHGTCTDMGDSTDPGRIELSDILNANYAPMWNGEILRQPAFIDTKNQETLDVAKGVMITIPENNESCAYSIDNFDVSMFDTPMVSEYDNATVVPSDGVRYEARTSSRTSSEGRTVAQTTLYAGTQEGHVPSAIDTGQCDSSYEFEYHADINTVIVNSSQNIDVVSDVPYGGRVVPNVTNTEQCDSRHLCDAEINTVIVGDDSSQDVDVVNDAPYMGRVAHRGVKIHGTDGRRTSRIAANRCQTSYEPARKNKKEHNESAVDSDVIESMIVRQPTISTQTGFLDDIRQLTLEHDVMQLQIQIICNNRHSMVRMRYWMFRVANLTVTCGSQTVTACVKHDEDDSMYFLRKLYDNQSKTPDDPLNQSVPGSKCRGSNIYVICISAATVRDLLQAARKCMSLMNKRPGSYGANIAVMRYTSIAYAHIPIYMNFQKCIQRVKEGKTH